MDFVWILLALIAAIACLYSIVIWSLRNGIAPMPTSSKAKKCLLEIIPSNITGPIYELGSGWGTLVYPLAKKYPSAQVIGFETSPIPYTLSYLRSLFGKPANMQLVKADFFTSSLSEAALVVCYLYPGAMRRLKDKFDSELKPGTWVVSNTFAIPGWIPIKTFLVGDIYNTKIYLYRIGV